MTTPSYKGLSALLGAAFIVSIVYNSRRDLPDISDTCDIQPEDICGDNRIGADSLERELKIISKYEEFQPRIEELKSRKNKLDNSCINPSTETIRLKYYYEINKSQLNIDFQRWRINTDIPSSGLVLGDGPLKNAYLQSILEREEKINKIVREYQGCI